MRGRDRGRGMTRYVEWAPERPGEIFLVEMEKLGFLVLEEHFA